MHNKQKEKNDTWLVLTRMVFLVIVGLITASLLGGCDGNYLPWNSNPWRGRIRRTAESHSEYIIQAPPENFCEDNRETVQQYRRFLEPSYVWYGSTATVARRQRYCRWFVEQYSRFCPE